MRILIEIECDNAAFETYTGVEIKRILNYVAGILSNADTHAALLDYDGYRPRDIDGNTCGTVKVLP